MECEGAAERTAGKTRILLVEHKSPQASVMKNLLESCDHEVIVADDGGAIVSIVETHNPDVIILDCLLPGLDSAQVCRCLKQNRDTSGIPIILLTDKNSTTDKVAVLTAGADDYILKPCDDDELSALICARLRTKSGWDELKQKTHQLQEMLTRVETLAQLDSLTGLYNRRRFEMLIGTEFKRAVRHELPLSCLVLDIDHFKTVNDTHGHQAGDQVLREMVRVIQQNIREIDTPARWGGEEFIILSPNTPKENALTVGERIRRAVANNGFSGVHHRQITVSIGIAGIPDPAMKTMEQLIHAADLSMYEAKKGGRNRVVVAA
jgi:two-component system cell cycle response regulator